MPLYICNTPPGRIPESAKPGIAEDVTRIHCDVTDAPRTFVHVFFMEQDEADTVLLQGNIRGGRTDEQKADMRAQMKAAIIAQAGLAEETVMVNTVDVPASWVMEGGDILPEPGEEAAWMERHLAKTQGTAPTT